MFGKRGKYEAVPTEAAVKYKKKSVKSNLLSAYFTSLLCLILCATMFMSTSMAWFTSEVTNTGNEIYVGMLDVKLLHQDGVDAEGKDAWVNLEDEANKEHKILDKNVLWAPEMLQVERLRVVNNGNLAFNYRLFMTIDHTEFENTADKAAKIEKAMKAAEYITVWVNQIGDVENEVYTAPVKLTDLTVEKGWKSVGTLAEVFAGRVIFDGSMGNDDVVAVDAQGAITIKSAVREYAVALHMAVNAPVEIMEAKLTGINIKLIAAQVASQQSEVSVVSTADELKTAMAEKGTVILVNDVQMDEPIAVSADADVTLDLNGHILTSVNSEESASCAIDNKGNLTIKNGTISYESAKPDASHGYGTNTINNNGNLVIDGATIINTTNGGSSNAIDNAPGATLIIHSGVIKSEKIAIRLRDNSNVTINGGEISGSRAVQIHLFQNVDEETKLTINGGVFNGQELALYSIANGNCTFAKTTVTINGGEFNGDVAFGGGNKTAEETVNITGGIFNGELGRYVPDGDDADTDTDWIDIAKP